MWASSHLPNMGLGCYISSSSFFPPSLFFLPRCPTWPTHSICCFPLCSFNLFIQRSYLLLFFLSLFFLPHCPTWPTHSTCCFPLCCNTNEKLRRKVLLGEEEKNGDKKIKKKNVLNRENEKLIDDGGRRLVE